MRVLLATPDYPPERGGIQLLLHRLVQHSRHEHRVITLGTGAPSQSGTADPEAVRVPRLLDHRASVITLNAEAVRQARKWRPDVALAGHVVTAPAALFARRHLGTPAVVYTYSDELRSRFRLSRFAVRRADQVVTISLHTRAQVLSLGADPTRVNLIPPGVDFSPRCADPAERDSERPTIATVARMEDRYKGFDVLLRALPLIRGKVPAVRWVVIGDGPLLEPLRATAAAWGLGAHCAFVGRVPDEVRDSWLRRSSVFALPSRVNSDAGGSEGFGIVYLEAGSNCLPCVAGAGTGATDAVVHGETGLIVDPGDHVQVAEAIVSLLADPARAHSMGLAGRRRAEKFTWGRMAAAIDDLLEVTMERAA